MEEYPNKPIGGLLVLYYIILICSLAFYGRELFRSIPSIRYLNKIQEFDHFFFIIFFAFLVTKFVAAMILFFIFMQRKSSTPKLVTIYEGLCIANRLVTLLTMPLKFFLVISLPIIAISITVVIYFKKSKRVKQTFLH
ncbi:DUF2569 domain-containing protein [Paenibacillus sp. P26]|nr:DUF2569 domain-containing protein [Paenibacillus sp. P26]UUZ92720.1 DUF2569 domain-containing protein [Paenibacillus sp. P25]